MLSAARGPAEYRSAEVSGRCKRRRIRPREVAPERSGCQYASCTGRTHLTPPSSGRPKGRFAPFGPPLMSNVRPRMKARWLVRAVALLCACAVNLSTMVAARTQKGPVILEAIPRIGARFEPGVESSHHELTAAGSLDRAYVVAVNGVQFTIAVSSKRDVVYVATTDTSFQTPENIRVGSSLASVRAAGAGEPLPESGWGFYTALPSGWQAAFTNGQSLSESPLPENARVRWLFQRQR